MDQIEIEQPEPRKSKIKSAPGIPEQYQGKVVEVAQELPDGRFMIRLVDDGPEGKLFSMDGKYLELEAVSNPQASRENLKLLLRKAVLSRMVKELADGRDGH